MLIFGCFVPYACLIVC